MTIHREGYPTLMLTALLLAAGMFGFHLAEVPPAAEYLFFAFAIILFIFFLNFFRNPKRPLHSGTDHIIAPADGKVVVIEETTENEVLKDKRLQVSIFMSPLNVHVNRSPVEGTVSYYKYHPGKYLVAWHPKSSTENERTTIGIQANNGKTYVMRQIAGALARRIVCYASEGVKVQAGSEVGFIKFGSRVDVFFPAGTKILVNIGDSVKGGITRIA